MTREEFFYQCMDIIEHWLNGNRKLSDLREVTDKLYNEVTKPHWISAEEELPIINPNDSEWEYSDDVIVALKDGSIAVGRYERDNSIGEHYWMLYGVDKDLFVTHWMPLPAPPKKGGEE